MTENEPDVPSPEAAPTLSWVDRHGAALVGGGLALVLVLVLILDRLIH